MIDPVKYTVRAGGRLYRQGKPVNFKKTRNTSGKFASPPVGIVIHDTAGPSLDSAVNWLTKREAKASCHVVIGERPGEVVQLASLNDVTWHAGRSRWQGRSNVNRFMLGIELVNPGKMTAVGNPSNGRGRPWWTSTPVEDCEYVVTDEHGPGMWKGYSPEQLAETLGIMIAMRDYFASADAVATHWEISPGRKVDVNPLFPMDHLMGALTGRAPVDDNDDDAGVFVGPTAVAHRVDVNMRRWPSNADNITAVMTVGSVAEVIRSGWYADGFPRAQWHLLKILKSGDQDLVGKEGWVHGAFVDLAK